MTKFRPSDSTACPRPRKWIRNKPTKAEISALRHARKKNKCTHALVMPTDNSALQPRARSSQHSTAFAPVLAACPSGVVRRRRSVRGHVVSQAFTVSCLGDGGGGGLLRRRFGPRGGTRGSGDSSTGAAAEATCGTPFSSPVSAHSPEGDQYCEQDDHVGHAHRGPGYRRGRGVVLDGRRLLACGGKRETTTTVIVETIRALIIIHARTQAFRCSAFQARYSGP